MLQAIREKTSGLIVKIVLGALIFAFSFFGIESYFVSRIDSYVAKAGDREISQQDFRTRFDEYRQQMTRMMGNGLDPAYFAKPEIKRQVLEQMVDEEIILETSEQLQVVVPAERLREEITKVPAFQVDGKFDIEQYKMLLAAQRMTPVGFEQRVRRDIAARELPSQIASTSFITDAEIDTFIRLRDQLRNFRYLKLDKPTLSNTQVDDAEIETYYQAHGQDFMNAEQIALSYVELDASQLKIDTSPDDATLNERYEKEKSRFVTEEQRLASHILIKIDNSSSPEEQKKALTKAEDVAKQAKSKQDFAQLAKQYSEDLGSKAQGGDLGWLEKGMTDPAFEAALTALNKGEISDPILSTEGYHIISLRDIRPGTIRSFDEVKTQLTKEYLDSERERLYSERSGRLTDLTYQDPSSLESAAKELQLTVNKTELFGRQGGQGIAANPKISKAAFSDVILVQGTNSDPIELGPNHIVVIRMAEHKPATPKPLDEVRRQIHDKIIAERITQQAKTHADELLSALEKDKNLDQIATELKLKLSSQADIGRNAANVDNALVQAVFSMPRPQQGKSSYQSVNLGNDTYALVQVEKVTDGDPSKLDEKSRDATRTTLTQNVNSEISHAFTEALRKNISVKIVEERM